MRYIFKFPYFCAGFFYGNSRQANVQIISRFKVIYNGKNMGNW